MGLLLLFAVLVSLKAVGQTAPVYSVPSPDVASLGQYGQIPVSLFTGTPDISVPLYEVRMGSFTLPISARYHLASVKPNLPPGTLGMGWSLDAGGYISRTVRGLYDEKCSSSRNAHGYYSHAAGMENITPSQFAQQTEGAYKVNYSASYELSADEFSFSFCGYSGTFYLNPSGGWTVVSDQDIQVEFNPQTDFASLSEFSSRIDYATWTNRFENNRFFKRFTLVAPDGYRYEFGGVNAIEFSISYYARNSSDLIATSWRLSKITDPAGREITFSYDTTQLMVDLRYAPQRTTKALTVGGSFHLEETVSTGNAGYTGFLLFPVCLTAITTPSETITLDYFSEYGYGSHYVTYGGNALYWDSPVGGQRHNIFDLNTQNPSDQFHVFMGTLSGTSDQMRNSIAGKLRHLMLHRLAIRPLDDNASPVPASQARSIYFEYTSEHRRKLSRITWREGMPDLIPDTVVGNGSFFLNGYRTPANSSTDDPPSYRFIYDDIPMPRGMVFCMTDSWGYNLGDSYSPGDVSNLSNWFLVRAAPLGAAQAESLREIIYPTGGRARFTYETHDYSRYFSHSTGTINESSGFAGGLRIAHIDFTDLHKKLLWRKKYYYAASRAANSPSSGVLREYPVHLVSYISSQNNVTQESCNAFFSSATNMNTPEVGYSCVIEETLDSLEQSRGYTVYRFTNYGQDATADDTLHVDEAASYAYNAMVMDAPCPYTSHAAERGRLLSKDHYDAAGHRIAREEYTYERVHNTSMPVATQEFIVFNHDPYSFSYGVMGWLTSVYTYSYLPRKVTTYEYDYQHGCQWSRSTTYTYDQQYRLLKSEVLTGSTGTPRTVTYNYPFDVTGYAWMADRHMISPVIEKTTSAGGMQRTERTDYAHTASPLQVPYVSQQSVWLNSAVNARTHYKVLSADSYGNPVDITEDGKPSRLTWDGRGELLLTRTENGSLNHQYTYNSWRQLLSYTDPSGQTLYYSYDLLGRLKEIYRYDGAPANNRETIKKYDYSYYDGATNR